MPDPAVLGQYHKPFMWAPLSQATVIHHPMVLHLWKKVRMLVPFWEATSDGDDITTEIRSYGFGEFHDATWTSSVTEGSIKWRKSGEQMDKPWAAWFEGYGTADSKRWIESSEKEIFARGKGAIFMAVRENTGAEPHIMMMSDGTGSTYDDSGAPGTDQLYVALHESGHNHQFTYQDGTGTLTLTSSYTKSLFNNEEFTYGVSYNVEDTDQDTIFYLDGVETASSSSTLSLSGNAATKARIGQSGNVDVSKSFQGAVYFMATFNQYLTDTEQMWLTHNWPLMITMNQEVYPFNPPAAAGSLLLMEQSFAEYGGFR